VKELVNNNSVKKMRYEPIIVGILTVALVWAFYALWESQPCVVNCPELGPDTEDPRTADPKTAVKGVLPLDCSLFQAIYLPWVKVPRYYNPKVYQPELSNFYFRLCWNVTTTNCWEHRFDFEPPKVFDTVRRIMTFAGRMYAYWLHSSSLKLGVLCFTGTAFTDDWAKNLLYPQVFPATLTNVGLDTRCHSGFYLIYGEIQAEILRIWKCFKRCTNRLFITGYSLGAALATLCAFDMGMEDNVLVYTFGGPRVFNPNGAKQLNRMLPNNWRVFNTEDIVTDLPPAVAGEKPWVDPLSTSDNIYEHAGRPVPWTDSRASWLDNHSRAYELFLLADRKPAYMGGDDEND
jgi:hypothetical protein